MMISLCRLGWASLSSCRIYDRSCTSVPGRPFHHVLRRHFSASSSFCKPSQAHYTSLSSQHIWPSAVFDRRSDGLELAAWRAQRSGVWFLQF